MENEKTIAAETSGGIQNEAGNNHEEDIRLPEQSNHHSDRRGRKPLPPPFLSKIYNIVDDPNTNDIISWGPNNTSFIIFDQVKFTSEILPNYFRHGNFSSFVYQLNNYGFKKSSWNIIEYENQWFQAGKKHWLKYIKRRNQIRQPEMPSFQNESSTSSNDSKMEIVREIEFLKDEQNGMKEEIEKLRKQRDELADNFTAFQENIRLADSKHEEIAIRLVVKKLLQNVSKRRKLTTSRFMDFENRDISEQNAGKEDASEKRQIQNDLNEIQSEAQISSLPNDSGSSNQDDEVETFPGNDENCAYWKKMLEDDSKYEYQEPEFEENKPIKLEDLVAYEEKSITNPFLKVEEDGHSSS